MARIAAVATRKSRARRKRTRTRSAAAATSPRAAAKNVIAETITVMTRTVIVAAQKAGVTQPHVILKGREE